MPATKVSKTTWFDLLPDGTPEPGLDSLFTREEVLNELRDRDVALGEGTLTYWEKAGIVPRPVRRWRAGAPRVLYPWWAVDAIKHARDLQIAGKSLRDIGPIMQMWALSSIDWQDPLAKPLADVRAALMALAREERRLFGDDIKGVVIQFTDGTERVVHKYEFSLPPIEDESQSLFASTSTSCYDDR